MRLHVINFPEKHFTKSEDGITLVSEASDMGNRHLQPLFDDSADAGFNVEMENGDVITFGFVELNFDRDGDITGWNYAATGDSIRKFPYCAKMKALVIND